MTPKVAFITRATGSQGLAVTKHLLSAGYAVHAIVADPDDDRSICYQALSPTHIKVFTGSLDDMSILDAAISGCTALFLNLMPNFMQEGGEQRQGQAILVAAKKAGVKHVVHSTMLGLDLIDEKLLGSNSGAAAVVLGKMNVEKAVREHGFEAWTILRPGYFMTNFLTPFNKSMWPGIENGEAASSYWPTTALNLTDVSDIGAFVAAAFSKPDQFNGKIIPVASQKLAVEEALSQLRAASGKDIKSVYRGDEESARLVKTIPIITAQLFQRNTTDNKVDFEEVKKWGVQLGTFSEFLDREKSWVDRTFVAVL